MQESERAQFMISWGEDDESSFKRGTHLGSACLSPQCLPSYEFSACKDKEKSTGGLVCFWDGVKLEPGGITYFQCPSPQVHQGRFSPRASVHSLSKSQGVEYTGVSQYFAISVPRKVSEPLTPCGWSQIFKGLMELSQVYLP